MRTWTRMRYSRSSEWARKVRGDSKQEMVVDIEKIDKFANLFVQMVKETSNYIRY